VKNTSLWLKIRAMFSDKFHPFVPHNWSGRKLIHSYARSVARIRTTLFIEGASDAILPPLRTFSLEAILQSRILSTTLRHQATWPDILAARFEYHFWDQNRTTFLSLLLYWLMNCPWINKDYLSIYLSIYLSTFGNYKIANFLQTRFNLWNRVFETLDFQNIKTLISLHMHFNKDKCKIGMSQIMFMGLLLNKHGVGPTE